MVTAKSTSGEGTMAGTLSRDIASKTGNAPIKRVGQTASGVFGIEPNAKVKGRPVEPTDLVFGK